MCGMPTVRHRYLFHYLGLSIVSFVRLKIRCDKKVINHYPALITTCDINCTTRCLALRAFGGIVKTCVPMVRL